LYRAATASGRGVVVATHYCEAQQRRKARKERKPTDLVGTRWGILSRPRSTYVRTFFGVLHQGEFKNAIKNILTGSRSDFLPKRSRGKLFLGGLNFRVFFDRFF
jgi:hypothetical protein